MSTKFLFLFLLVCGKFSFIQAQVNITGKVADQTNDQPIEYGNVALFDRSDSTLVDGGVTDATGQFRMANIAPGNYFLRIQFLGYRSLFRAVDATGNGTIDVGDIFLTPDERLLDEVRVTGEKATLYNELNKQVYEADQFLSGQGGTATDIIRNMPSVTLNAEGELAIRGSTGFVLLLNGRPVQTSPGIILNQLPANTIERIEIITTPGARYDSEGKAGIVNIISKRGAADGTYVQVNAKIGLPSVEDYNNAEPAPRYGADVLYNRIKGPWDVLVGVSYLRNDISGRREGDVWTLIDDKYTRFPSDGERSFDEENYSGSFSVRYTLPANQHVGLSFYAGKRTKERTADILYNNVGIRQSTGDTLYTLDYFNENLRIRRGDFILGSLDYDWQLTDNSSLKASLLYEYTLLGGPTTNINYSWPLPTDTLQDQYNTNDNPLYGFRANIDFETQRGKSKLAAGYQFRSLDHDGDFIYEDRIIGTNIWELQQEFSSQVDLERYIHTLYSQWNYTTERWDLEAGARLEYMDRTLDLLNETVNQSLHYDFLKLFPSARIGYKLSEQTSLHTAYSKRVDRTTSFKMNPFPEREHSETLEQGDAELLPEFTDALEVGVQHVAGNNTLFLHVYYRNVANLINRVNTVYNDTILNRIYSNVGNGKSVGFEIGADLNPTKWWKFFFGGNVYQYTIDGEFDNRPVFTQSWLYIINATTTFYLAPTWELQGTLNYLSDRNTAQGEDSRFLQPSLSLKKTFLDDRLSVLVQWLNIDMGLLPTNEQRITTSRTNEFFTTTNYVYEVDMIMLNISYSINQPFSKNKLLKSEFGEQEF